MEIYVHSTSSQILGVYSWHRNTVLQLQNQGLISEYQVDDEGIYRFWVHRCHLPIVLKLDGHTRRPHAQGKWIKDKEKRLGHSIRPQIIEAEVLKGFIETAPEKTDYGKPAA